MNTLTLFSFEGMEVTKTYLLKNIVSNDNIDIPENKISSDDSCGVPSVPIPNTVIKPTNAEGTWLETAWEIRKLLVLERKAFRCSLKTAQKKAK